MRPGGSGKALSGPGRHAGGEGLGSSPPAGRDADRKEWPDLRNNHYPERPSIVPHHRCLLVDDSDAFLEAAKVLLQREGVTVAGVASSSAEALRKARALRPDVIIVDVGLGDESGFDLARLLARDGHGGGAAVILISACAETDLPAPVWLPQVVVSWSDGRGGLVRGVTQSAPCSRSLPVRASGGPGQGARSAREANAT